MRSRFLGVLGLAAALYVGQAASPSPAVRMLSLRECIDLALSRNLGLRIEHLTVELAGYNLSSSYGVYDPVFSFGARHDFISQPSEFDLDKFNPHLPYELNSDTLGPDLAGKLPLGMSYDFRAFTREINARTDFSSIADDARSFPPDGIRRTNEYNALATLTIQQHLLKDFWIDSDREKLLLRRKDLKMSQQAVRFLVMKTVLGVELRYYDLVAARETVRTQEKALELRQQLVNETRRRIQVGDLPPLDADQAETQLQNTVTALAAARENLALQQNALKALLTDNFREWADLDLIPADSLLALPPALNRSESFASALRDRPDLIEARLAVEKSDVVVKFRQNQLFPSLDAIGRYGGFGSEDDAGHTINQSFNFVYPEYSYGVVLSFPLSNIGERNNYRASKAAREIARLQLRKAEEEVLVEIADYVHRVESRFTQVTSTRKARTYAEAALAAEQKKLQNGFSTSFFVLQLQEILTAASTAEVQALADYNKMVAQLAFADGTTLEKHRLNLEIK